jgi:hypothetical protein
VKPEILMTRIIRRLNFSPISKLAKLEREKISQRIMVGLE